MSDLSSLLPNQEALLKRFAFIKNDVLRTNLAVTYRHVIFLMNLQDEHTLPGPILQSIYKDIILHTGMIIESCVHHLLSKYFESDKEKKNNIMPEIWIEDSCKIL